MDKIDFISWMLMHFNISDLMYESEMNKYNSGLFDDIDFKLLKEFVESNYKYRPSSIELNRIATMNKFRLKKDEMLKCAALKHYKELRKIPHIKMSDFPEELKLKMRCVLKKYGIVPQFDR